MFDFVSQLYFVFFFFLVKILYLRAPVTNSHVCFSVSTTVTATGDANGGGVSMSLCRRN